MHRVAHGMDVFDGSVWQNNPEVVLVSAVSRHGLFEYFARSLKIVRMDLVPEFFSRWHALARIEAVDSEHLLGPVP
jgi:hypothetical protein